jgi:hypothetical protein
MNEVFTLKDLNEVINNDEKVKRAFDQVVKMEKWILSQGLGLKQMINNKRDEES